MRKIFFNFLIFIPFFCAAQKQQINLEWVDAENVSSSADEPILIPSFDAKYRYYDINLKKLRYVRSFDGTQYYEISNPVYEDVNTNLLNNIDVNTSQLEYKFGLGKARNSSKTVLELNPFVKVNNKVQRLVSFTLAKTSTKPKFYLQQKSNNDVPSVQNSVLASGKWRKFYVEESGIHRIDLSFLRDLGFSNDEISPNTLKIYSHGGKMLPLINADTPPDFFGLPEIPLQLDLNNPTQLASGDAIYFYAEATEGQYSQENETHLNLYADRAYYYVTFNGGNGKRITPAAEPTAPAIQSITTFNDLQYYEVDESSLSLVGRRWFGDRFDITTQRNYSFEFPNLVTSEPVQLRILLGGIAVNTTSFSVGLNGEFLGNASVLSTGRDLPSRGTTFSRVVDVNSNSIEIALTYNKQGNPAARGFLDYIQIQAVRELTATNQQFSFQNNQVAQQIGVGEYILGNASRVEQVWDITDIHNVQAYNNQQASNTFSFKVNLGEPRKYHTFLTTDVLRPRIDASQRNVVNQNLKGSIFNNSQGQFEDVDYVVITHSNFIPQANRLANLRANSSSLTTRVVSLQEIYNEFNSGKQDIAAIRNFIRYMYYNASSPENRLKFVAIIGDTSVDYKDRLQGNNNIVPTFQSLGSFATTVSSFMSDDFYTMMDPDEGRMIFSNELMDIAVGRIVADTPQIADQMIDKIEAYESRPSYASWRNNFLLISDDVDVSWEHQQIQVQLDDLGDEISANKPNINVKKIHSDAFQQISSAGGDRYPEVNKAITEEIELGVSVVNYFGHGGVDGLAQERIVTVGDVQSWRNPSRYNVFITVTCDFTKFDNPLRVTAGELCYQNPQGGPVSLITTTRAIGVGDGVSFNNVLAPFLFDYQNTGNTVGEAVQQTKNNLGTNGKRIVFYIGDPALKLPYGEPSIRLTSLNDQAFGQANDTLKGLSKNKISGEIVDASGNRITTYNGNLTTTIFDKRIERSTLANNGTTNGSGELLVLDFTTLGETLFKGQSTVREGIFDVEFILPKDTRVPVDNGRISMYAVRDNILEDQVGFSNEILVGGINENAPEDNDGPLIQLSMNDETFVDGGITNSSPFILANLEDMSGINTAGGIGHDIVAILDENDENPVVLNEYYEAEADNFTRGKVYYQLRDLEPGPHVLRFRAWDTYNNSSLAEIHFTVSSEEELSITRVLNYPNPFTDYTEFWFNHNRPFEPLEVQVQVFTVTGKVVWSQNQVINTDGFLSRDIIWNGRDDFGDRIGKGVYVYKLTVRSTLTNQKSEKYEKLVIL
ncbi:type IX secretion system sortase PorU [Psychroflexus salis]|uniref:Peptidase C25 n=1 Tax=Psychroflexus salis TaxID=1526574 RepID=A0A916ZY97_9FLAO|nr:type IX secretion system sortase PorU [Psychroflexus salis]GGE18859.1 peptidase C25 [Psychroflexus salis]